MRKRISGFDTGLLTDKGPYASFALNSFVTFGPPSASHRGIDLPKRAGRKVHR